MPSYEPIDLSGLCNAGPEWLGRGQGELRGLHTLRGLPFSFGPTDSEAPCFLAFGPQGFTERVSIAIQRPASWVIVAHRLLDSRIPEGDPLGHVVALYHFRYADGEEATVSVRERFEISTVPVEWGQLPFLAVSDRQDGLKPRLAGPWQEAGMRLAEAFYGWPEAFVLWAWANPRPETEVNSLIIEPADRAFLVAGITVSTWGEDPFGRQPSIPVRITLLEDEQARRPFDLGVEIDRGVATYPYPLPGESVAEFLSSPLRGWGQAYQGGSSPAYVEIAGQPSSVVRVHSGGGEELIRVNWQQLNEQKTAQGERARLEVLRPEKNWVRVTVVDAETGRPIPCRVHFRSLDGIPYQPHGHHNHLLSDMGTWHHDIGGDVRLGHATYAYINGRCEGWLPRGQLLVDIARGYEYEPLRTVVTVAPGQQALTLQLKRWENMNARGWYSGDTHVHFLSTTGALLEAQGEDLNVVNLLQSQWGHLFTNVEDFVGRPVTTDDGRHVVYTSQENRQHILGHLTLLGLKQPVMPLCSDGPDEAELGGTLEATLCHWADACHAQGGTVIVPHAPLPNCEAAALIATQRADALEMLVHSMYQHVEYYRYLRAGYRLPLVGGTDKMTSDVPVGLYRTYVRIPDDEPFTYESWCANLRRGRTFLSGGPLITLDVEGLSVGDTLALPAGGRTVEVEARADSILPMGTLEIVHNGRVVASSEATGEGRELRLRQRIAVSSDGWLAARVGGRPYAQPVRHHDGWQRGVMAHTSPVYVSVGGSWSMRSAEAAQYMLTLIEGGLAYIRQRSRLHPPGSVTHHHREADHLAYLERPFHEAMAAIADHLNPTG